MTIGLCKKIDSNDFLMIYQSEKPNSEWPDGFHFVEMLELKPFKYFENFKQNITISGKMCFAEKW